MELEMREDNYIRACRDIFEKVLAGEIEDENQLNRTKKKKSVRIIIWLPCPETETS